MNVDVIIAAGDVRSDLVSGKTVIVVDVFRATSVIINALANGARKVIPVVSVEQALQLKKKINDSRVLLGGERNAVKIAGFDKDNSPLAYTREDVEQATIIFTSTNGTRAVHNSRTATDILIGAMTNLTAVSGAASQKGRDVVVVCSGSSDRFTAEDGLCAGAIAGCLEREYGYVLSDIAQVLRDMYDIAKGDMKVRLSTTKHYNFVLGKGFTEDIDFCLNTDSCEAVPYYDKMKGEIKL